MRDDYEYRSITYDHLNTRPTLFFTTPVNMEPPMPPMPIPHLDEMVSAAHFCFASRSLWSRMPLIKCAVISWQGHSRECECNSIGHIEAQCNQHNWDESDSHVFLS